MRTGTLSGASRIRSAPSSPPSSSCCLRPPATPTQQTILFQLTPVNPPFLPSFPESCAGRMRPPAFPVNTPAQGCCAGWYADVECRAARTVRALDEAAQPDETRVDSAGRRRAVFRVVVPKPWAVADWQPAQGLVPPAARPLDRVTESPTICHESQKTEKMEHSRSTHSRCWVLSPAVHDPADSSAPRPGRSVGELHPHRGTSGRPKPSLSSRRRRHLAIGDTVILLTLSLHPY